MKDPAFSFYYQDFLVGTAFMSLEATGAYIKCLCHQAHNHNLTEQQIKAICVTDETFRQVIPKFKTDETGGLYNERCRYEVNKRRKYSESRSTNRKGDQKQEVEQEQAEEVEPEPEVVVEEKVIGKVLDFTKELNIPFEFWWDEYRKKVGDIKKLTKKWSSLTEVDRVKAFEHTKRYVIATPDKAYRKNPETYLNNKAWNDEIITKSEIHINGNAKKSLREKIGESNDIVDAMFGRS